MASDDIVLNGVRQAFLILSGKGGVGKSSVCVQLAASLWERGFRVGILDVDLCGPSIPRILNVENRDILLTPDGKWIPICVDLEKRFSVMSMAYFLESKNDAVIWRGPKKNAMIKQLLTLVEWKVDFLLIDTPPGTSDEHISLMENLRNITGTSAILVTTPQLVSVDDVKRELTFCRRTGIDITGIIENMSGFVCPHCSKCSQIFATGGGEELALKCGVKFLGSVPICPSLNEDQSDSFLIEFKHSAVHSIFMQMLNNILPQV